MIVSSEVTYRTSDGEMVTRALQPGSCLVLRALLREGAAWPLARRLLEYLEASVPHAGSADELLLCLVQACTLVPHQSATRAVAFRSGPSVLATLTALHHTFAVVPGRPLVLRRNRVIRRLDFREYSRHPWTCRVAF